jgi:hypothetical protein
MKSFLSAACFALAFVSLVANSACASIEFAQTGDDVIFHDGPGNRGGVFYVDVVGKTSSSSPYDGTPTFYDFPTFCVEITEYITLGSEYNVANISNTTVLSNKTLGSLAAWLYTEYLKPVLGVGPGITAIAGWGGDAAKDANAIQYLIWKSMGWDDTGSFGGVLGSYDSTFLTNLRAAYAADVAWTGAALEDANWNRGTYTGNVAIMNITGPVPGDHNAQDQLVWIPPGGGGFPGVPEPISGVVWSLLAMGAMCVSSRRGR